MKNSLDLIIKQGRLKTSYDSYLNKPAQTKASGSYHNWGTSLSAEYGYRKALSGGWYVEPQSEFTFGRVSSAGYTASDGTSVRHDSLNSIVGRLGLSIGRMWAAAIFTPQRLGPGNSTPAPASPCRAAA